MAREVSEMLASLRASLENDYPHTDWRVATMESTIANPTANLIGTVAVDDREEEDEATDQMTGALYLDIPVVVSLYFARGLFHDYALPRDYAFTIGAWFRRRQVAVPSQKTSRLMSVIREMQIDQKIIDGVDFRDTADWMLWQVRAIVPLGITPQFPAIAGVFDDAQGPPLSPDIRFDEAFFSMDPMETDPANAERLVP